VNTVVNGIPIVQARSNGTAYDLVDLVRHDDGTRSWRARVETVYADSVTPDSGVTAMLNRYRPMVERLSTRRVAVLRDSLVKRGNQYPLGNLIADAQRAARPGTTSPS
jgi:2',3'-cyclic-nucleotide 2'-phosphodiesterase (5'-nucleotidase family)